MDYIPDMYSNVELCTGYDYKPDTEETGNSNTTDGAATAVYAQVQKPKRQELIEDGSGIGCVMTENNIYDTTE